jgi:23S rRNA pseudouridine1911/1915/1917 synthase
MKAPNKRYVHLMCEAQSTSLLDFSLSHLQNLSAAHLRSLIHLGAVYINKKRERNPEAEVKKGEIIRIHLEPKRYPYDQLELLKRIIFEDKNFILINKPSGLPVHATLDNFHENLIAALHSAKNQPIFVTHRLDVPTSGLIVLAKNKNFQKLFNQLISDRLIEKTYEATVTQKVSLGKHRHWMLSSPKAPKLISDSPPSSTTESQNNSKLEKWEECLLEIMNLKSHLPYYKLKIKLLTGRTHQIRAQLSHLGAPIIGDEMYGGISSDSFGLRATQLQFKCPVTNHDFDFSL